MLLWEICYLLDSKLLTTAIKVSKSHHNSTTKPLIQNSPILFQDNTVLSLHCTFQSLIFSDHRDVWTAISWNNSLTHKHTWWLLHASRALPTEAYLKKTAIPTYFRFCKDAIYRKCYTFALDAEADLEGHGGLMTPLCPCCMQKILKWEWRIDSNACASWPIRHIHMLACRTAATNRNVESQWQCRMRSCSKTKTTLCPWQW